MAFSSVQSLSHVWLFATPWTAAHQASLSITNSGSPSKPMPIESVMPSNHHMCSACKLNNQGDNIQPWCTLFPIWNQSIVPRLVQTVASWPAYRFLRRQVRWSGIPLSEKFPTVCCDPRKGFGIVNKPEVDVFLELLLFLWSSGYWQFDLQFLCLF